MRSVLALLLLASAFAPAAAAPAHHVRPRHSVVVHPDANATMPPAWFPGYRPIPPSENRNLDPSNFGGG